MPKANGSTNIIALNNVDVRIENANRTPQNQAPVNEGSGSARQWLQRWPAGMARQRFSGDVLRND
ncbi:MAG: hypothetical protein ACLQUZ_13105, partial [Rhizomicrobium sp.]